MKSRDEGAIDPSSNEAVEAEVSRVPYLQQHGIAVQRGGDVQSGVAAFLLLHLGIGAVLQEKPRRGQGLDTSSDRIVRRDRRVKSGPA